MRCRRRLGLVPAAPLVLLVVVVAVAVGVAVPAARALAAPVAARISASGVGYIGQQVPGLIPRTFRPPPATLNLYSCGDNDFATVTQQNTTLDLTIDQLSLSLPATGILRIDVTLSASARGDAYLDKLYACTGSQTCSDSLSIRGAHALVDFAASVDGAGKPHLALANVQLELAREDVDVEVSGCPEGPVVTALIGVAKDYALDLALQVISNLAMEQVGPKLEQAVAGLMSYSGNVAFTAVNARLTRLDFLTTGIEVGADVDLLARFPAAACLAADPGPPAAFAGVAPDLARAPDAHLAVAVNLGLVANALYQVWHQGYLCVTPDSLRGLGIDLDPALAAVAPLLPGFPAGTRVTAEVRVGAPPTVEGSAAADAKLTLHVDRTAVDLLVIPPDGPDGPDGNERRLHLDLDISATAEVALDPASNTLTLRVDEVRVDRMAVDDQLGLAQMGFDFARVRMLLETMVLPRILAQVGSIPVSGRVFGGMDGVYAILRGLETTPAYLAAKADLFHAPADDHDPPTTQIVSRPSQAVRPADARLGLGGTDAQDPPELLKFLVSVDGAPAAAPTFRHQIAVGAAGATATYHVVVKAVDLAGNVDPVGASADVLVDGVLPTLTLDDPPRGVITTVRPRLSWRATDDLTASGKLVARVRVIRTPLHGGDAETPISDVTLPPGAREIALAGLQPGRQYRAEVTVSDEAGNQAASTALFEVSPDASDGQGCGCVVGGAGRGHRSPVAALLLLGVAFFARLLRRRPRAIV
jgi:MYXO-CTERM domain-containing protein